MNQDINPHRKCRQPQAVHNRVDLESMVHLAHADICLASTNREKESVHLESMQGASTSMQGASPRPPRQSSLMDIKTFENLVKKTLATGHMQTKQILIFSISKTKVNILFLRQRGIGKRNRF